MFTGLVMLLGFMTIVIVAVMAMVFVSSQMLVCMLASAVCTECEKVSMTGFVATQFNAPADKSRSKYGKQNCAL